MGICVFVCYTKAMLSIGWWWDQAASPCYRRHNQVGPGGLWLSWPRNTQGCSMGRKLLGGLGVKLITWCVTETHHLSLIHVFERQGCNVALLVCKDLFQIAVPEGSAALHV